MQNYLTSLRQYSPCYKGNLFYQLIKHIDTKKTFIYNNYYNYKTLHSYTS